MACFAIQASHAPSVMTRTRPMVIVLTKFSTKTSLSGAIRSLPGVPLADASDTTHLLSGWDESEGLKEDCDGEQAVDLDKAGGSCSHCLSCRIGRRGQHLGGWRPPAAHQGPRVYVDRTFRNKDDSVQARVMRRPGRPARMSRRGAPFVACLDAVALPRTTRHNDPRNGLCGSSSSTLVQKQRASDNRPSEPDRKHIRIHERRQADVAQ